MEKFKGFVVVKWDKETEMPTFATNGDFEREGWDKEVAMFTTNEDADYFTDKYNLGEINIVELDFIFPEDKNEETEDDTEESTS